MRQDGTTASGHEHLPPTRGCTETPHERGGWSPSSPRAVQDTVGVPPPRGRSKPSGPAQNFPAGCRKGSCRPERKVEIRPPGTWVSGEGAVHCPHDFPHQHRHADPAPPRPPGARPPHTAHSRACSRPSQDPCRGQSWCPGLLTPSTPALGSFGKGGSLQTRTQGPVFYRGHCATGHAPQNQSSSLPPSTGTEGVILHQGPRPRSPESRVNDGLTRTVPAPRGDCLAEGETATSGEAPSQPCCCPDPGKARHSLSMSAHLRRGEADQRLPKPSRREHALRGPLTRAFFPEDLGTCQAVLTPLFRKPGAPALLRCPEGTRSGVFSAGTDPSLCPTGEVKIFPLPAHRRFIVWGPHSRPGNNH